MNLIVLVIFSFVQLIVGEPASQFNDVESTTDTIKLTSFPSILIPKLTTNLGPLINKESRSPMESISVQSVSTTQISLLAGEEASQLIELASNRTTKSPEPSTNRTAESSSNAEKLIKPSPNRTEELTQSITQAVAPANLAEANHMMLSKPMIGYTITTVEIRKANQTLLSTILLRVHSILQYSSNFSRRAVIPYVYMAKLQATNTVDSLYRQIADSTFLQNYASNVFQTLVNDVMNQECNAITTMLNYVLMPAIDAHGSNYLTARTRELSDGVGRWHNAMQRWSASLSSFFSQIADLKFEDCGQALLCSLGKAKYESVREEPRANRAKAIQFINNLLNMPMLEKRLKTNYALARQYGASGGDCGSLNSNCIINFDTLFNLARQLF